MIHNIHIKDRFLSILLTLLIIVSAMPLNVSAEAQSGGLYAEIFELNDKGEKELLSKANFQWEFFVSGEKSDEGSALSSEEEESLGEVDLSQTLLSYKDDIDDENKSTILKYSVSYDGYREIKNVSVELTSWDTVISVEMQHEYKVNVSMSGPGKAWFKTDSDEEYSEFNDALAVVKDEKYSFKFTKNIQDTDYKDASLAQVTIGSDPVFQASDDEYCDEKEFKDMSFEEDTTISVVYEGLYSVSVDVSVENVDNIVVKFGDETINADDDGKYFQNYPEGTQNIKVSVKANDGYLIKTVADDNTEKYVNEYTHTIESLSENIALNLFVFKAYKVKANYNSEFGKITIDDKDPEYNETENYGEVSGIVSGSEITLEATPNDTYTITSVSIPSLKSTEQNGITFDENGDYFPEKNTYTSTEPLKINLRVEEDVEAEFTFALLIYTVTASAVDEKGGSVDPDSQEISYGKTAKYEIKVNNGYEIDRILINDIEIEPDYDNTEDISIEGIYGNFHFEGADDGTIVINHNGVINNESLTVLFKEIILDNSYIVEGDFARSVISDKQPGSLLYVLKEGDSFVIKPNENNNFIGVALEDPGHDTNNEKIEIKEDAEINKLYVGKARWSEYIIWNEVDLRNSPIKVNFDNAAPVIDGTEPEEYYSTDTVSLNVKVSDLKDSDKDTENIDTEKSSGLGNVSCRVEYTNVVMNNTEDASAADVSTDIELYNYEEQEEKSDLFNIDTDIDISTQEYKYSNVKITLNASDRAGHSAEPVEKTFTIVKYAPEVTVQSADNNDGTAYKERTYTVTVKEPKREVFSEDKAYFTVNDSTKKLAWKEEPKESGVYTATMTFADKDADFTENQEYSWEFSYTNKAGVSADNIVFKNNEGNEITEGNINRFCSFILDTQAPTGKIIYNEKSWIQRIIDELTFDIFSNNEITVTAESEDLTTVTTSYFKDTVGENLKNHGYKYKVLSENELLNKEFVSEPYIVSEKDESFVIYAKFVDEAGNVSYACTDGLVFDNTGTPNQIEFTPDKKHYGEYYNHDFNVKIRVDELLNTSGNSYSGLKEAAYKVESNGKITDQGDLLKGYEKQEEELIQYVEKPVTINASGNNSDNVTLTVNATDNAGNSYSKSISFKVNVTEPTVSVKFHDKPQVKKAVDERGYYNADRVAEITIVDRAGAFNEDKASRFITEGITASDTLDGKTIDLPYTLGEWTADNENPDSHKITVTFSEEAYYKWKFNSSYINDSGNESKPENIEYAENDYHFDFVIDKTAPTGKIIYNEKSWIQRLIDELTFDIFSNNKITVTAESDKDLTTVTTSYFKDTVDKNLKDYEYKYTVLSESELLNKEFVSKPYTVSKDESFVIYAKFVDEAGNISYVYTDGMVFDKTGTEEQIKFTPDKKHYGEYYNHDFNVKIRVDELLNTSGNSYSGLKEAAYKVECNEVITDQGDLLKDYEKQEEELIQYVEKTVRINASKNNSDNVKLTVNATDNAGNSYSKSISFKVNVTPPTVKVEFRDTPKVKKVVGNRGYYNAARVADITITDRNSTFDEKAASESITKNIAAVNSNNENLTGTLYTLGTWTPDSEDPDVHKITVTFSQNANYSWNFDTYKNKAGLENKSVNNAGSETPNYFTVDKKSPSGTIRLSGAGEKKWTEDFSELFSATKRDITVSMFSNSAVNIGVVNSKDDVSPFDIYYYKTNAVEPLSEEELDLLPASDWKKFKNSELEKSGITPDPGELFVLYIKFVDYAGNYRYINSDGCIVTNNAGRVLISMQTKPNSNGIYGREYLNDGIKVSVTAAEEELYAGVKSIEYWLTEKDNSKHKSKTFSVYSVNKASREELEKAVTTEFVIGKELLNEFNGCSAVLHVRSEDNAGNKCNAEIELDIDAVQPKIKVNLSGDTNNNSESGFYTSQKAQVIITERQHHFDPNKVLFKVTAVDSNGEAVKNPYTVSDWKTTKGKTDDEDTHTATVTFVKDANYTFEVSYTDNADNAASTVRSKAFTVDTTPPVGIVRLDDHFWNHLFSEQAEKITFGIFKSKNISVRADVSDATSPFKTEYFKTDRVTAYTKAELDKLSSEKWKPFEELSKSGLDPDQRAVVYLKLTDNAGNYCYINSNGAIIDNVPPEITLTPQASNSNGVYGASYNGYIGVNVDVKDSAPYSGLKTVEYWTVDNGEKSESAVLYNIKNEYPNIEKEEAYPTHDGLKSEFHDTIKINQAEHNSTDTKLFVKSVDNAGKISISSVSLDIDITAPSIKVEFISEDKNGAHSGYFTYRAANITVTERTDHFDPDNVIFNVSAKDYIGTTVNTPYSVSAWKTNKGDTPDEDTHSAQITFVKDANYTFDVTYTDDAGNSSGNVDYGKSQYYNEFTVDTVPPDGKIELADRSWNFLFTEQLKTLTFGIFNNTVIDVSAEITDEVSPSDIEYYISDGTTALSGEELDKVTTWLPFSDLKAKGIKPDQKAAVYLKLIDYAGNYRYINSDGIVVEQTPSVIELTPILPNENGCYGDSYNGYVDVDVSVNDAEPYSGIKTVECWTVDDGKTSEIVKLYDVKSDFPNIEKEEGAPQYSLIKSNYDGKILIKQSDHNSTNTQLYVKVVDNAGNESYKSLDLDIDVTKPKINVEFSGNVNPKAQKGYYISRQATVTVTERTGHFDPENVVLTITAENSLGEKVNFPYTISSWKHEEGTKANNDDDRHTATITFDKDANYTFDISYVDNAGNKSEPAEYGDSVDYRSFTVDTVAPEGSVSLDDRSWNYLFTEQLKSLTFGIFKNTRIDVSENVSDETSPYIVEYYITDSTAPFTKSALDTLSNDEWNSFSDLKRNGITPNERATVYLRLIDYAGNYRYINTNGAIADDVAALIRLTPEKPNNNGIYGLSYNGNVDVNVFVKDGEPYSGIKTVEYWTEVDGVKTEDHVIYDFSNEFPAANTEEGAPLHNDLRSTFNDTIKVSQADHNSTDTKLFVKAVDNAGNESIEQVDLDIDITAPKIQVEYSGKSNKNAEEGFFTSREAVITITERSNHFDPNNVKLNISSKDAKGVVIDNSWSLGEWKTDLKSDKDYDLSTHSVVLKFEKEANYNFDISYADNAGNLNEAVDVSGQIAPFAFTVDKTSPTGVITAVSQEGRKESWSSAADAFSYGFWSNSSITVTAAEDDLTSPIKSVEYYMPVSDNAVDNTSALTKKELDAKKDWHTFNGLSVDENKQFAVYLKITDNAGNYTYISTNGLIVDDTHPLAESVAPEISVSPQYPINGIYRGDVNVDIVVTDPTVGGTYSGINEIHYSVFDRTGSTPNEPTQSGVLYNFNNSDPSQNELLKQWKGSIQVDSSVNNSNEIQIVVYASDNAGNAGDSSQIDSPGYCVIEIDTTAPTISISYDNNNADNEVYFNSDRVAYISIIERNFDPNDVKLPLTDGVTLSGWGTVSGSYNGDDTVHTAELRYSSDGDYNFSIEYTDLAGNPASSIAFEEGTVAPESFTIDKTLPAVTVVYDNNSAQNSNYYNKDRTATITVNEHNFDSSRVNITLEASDDGKTVSVPSVGGWSDIGDIHTTTIRFDKDALYKFDIAVKDKASNDSADYSADSFYIDKTAPVVIISGVKNESANSGDCIPVISYSDTNIDLSKVAMALSGVNRKAIEPSGSFSDIHNGRVFTFENFAKKKVNDDIYTLSGSLMDKAGNTVNKKIQFSVNRFGSTYSLSEEVEKINGAYTTTPVDVVLTEINANKLSNQRVTLFKNRDTILLERNKDYKMDVSGGNGKWYTYTYTIFKDVFEEDGLYEISIHSEDEAGNIAENTLDTKGVKVTFGVDKTIPTINVKNIEDGRTYAVDNITVLVSANDNLNLKSLKMVLDDKTEEEWEGTKLTDVVNEGDDFTFDISGASTKAHTLKLIATDSAGNVAEDDISDFYVTTSLFIRFVTNRPLFVGSIIGVVLFVVMIVFILTGRRRSQISK